MTSPARSIRGRRRSRWQDVAVLNVGTPVYAKDLAFSLEIAVAFLDNRPAASWLIEPEERWGRGQQEADYVLACFGEGLGASVVARELRSATAGYRVYSKDFVAAKAWLDRLSAACGLDLGIKVLDFWSIAVPADPRREVTPKEDVEWAERWSYRAVPDTPRMAVIAARDVAFLRELLRLATSP